jgi:hypothetical protein
MMKKEEKNLKALEEFLPPDTFDRVVPFFREHTIHLTLTHERKSVLGDYRVPTREQPYHRISINATLNRYSFLITLLHELAHLLTWEHFGRKAAPHGREWKTQFRHMLVPFMGRRIFPSDVEEALHAYLQNPAASTCTDARLYKALYRYDNRKPGYRLVDDIRPEGHFMTDDGRIWQKVEALRTRARCRCLKTGKMYFFQGIVEVKMLK